MPRRSKSWDRALSEKLKDKEYAKHFLMALIEDEGLPLKEALRETILSYGVSEFARECGLLQPNLHKALEEESNPTASTLEKILKPFGLSLGARDLEGDLAS